MAGSSPAYHMIGEENKMLRISGPSIAIAMATVIFWPLMHFLQFFSLYVFAHCVSMYLISAISAIHGYGCQSERIEKRR